MKNTCILTNGHIGCLFSLSLSLSSLLLFWPSPFFASLPLTQPDRRVSGFLLLRRATGIGLAIAKKLAHAPGHLCILTSRNPALGQRAADDLKGEGLESVVYKQLDIGDPASVEVQHLSATVPTQSQQS